jgi:RimJ/RimL family protein N-acetyltransferase
VEWVARQTHEFGNFGTDIGIGLEQRTAEGWRMIAGVAYSQWNGVNVVCDIASDGSKRWMTRDYLWHIFDYPFRQLGCQRITVCIGEANTVSRRFCEHLGFELEAVLEKAHPTGDLLVYRLRKPECRWLTLRKTEHEERLAA